MTDDDIPSPCTRECALGDDACLSCGRTLPELVNWASMTDEERADVLERLTSE